MLRQHGVFDVMNMEDLSSRCRVEHIDEDEAEGDEEDNSGGHDVL